MTYSNSFARFAAGLALAAGMVWSQVLLAAPACIDPEVDAAASVSGGIGGTGMRAEGGIGGTGIIGTVTGFASVCINGLEVHFDPATPVTQNGVAVDTAALALGQVIAIDASSTELGLVARQISILNVLEGPATGAALAHGVLEVMGQTVHVDAATRWGGLDGLEDVQPGAALKVAGYRDARGEVHATRVEKTENLSAASAIGILNEGDRLHDLSVQTVQDKGVVGGEVLLRGVWNGKQLVAQTVQPDPSLPFAGHAERIVMEGLVSGHADQAHLRVGGFEVVLSDRAQTSGMQAGHFVEGQHIRVTGRLEGRRRIVADDIRLHVPRHQPTGGVHPPHANGMGNMPAERPAMRQRMERTLPQQLGTGMQGMKR